MDNKDVMTTLTSLKNRFYTDHERYLVLAMLYSKYFKVISLITTFSYNNICDASKNSVSNFL